MRPSLKNLFEESPTRAAVREEIARYARDHASTKALVLDLGGGLYRYDDLFSRYAAVNVDRTLRPEIVADLAALPVRDRSIEACISVAVLEHVADPMRVLAEIARILTPGGTTFLWVPFLHEVHPYPIDHWRFAVEGIRILIQRVGLEPLEASPARFQGAFRTLAHLYRFVFPPTQRRLGWKLAGFSILHFLTILDRWLPASRFYTGVACIARAP